MTTTFIVLEVLLAVDIIIRLWDLFSRRTHSAIDKTTEDVNTLTEILQENNKHIEGITECVEEMNRDWEEQIREYLEWSEEKESSSTSKKGQSIK